MKLSADKRLLVAWLVVVAITLIYLVIDGSADDGGVLVASTAATVGAIAEIDMPSVTDSQLATPGSRLPDPGVSVPTPDSPLPTPNALVLR